MTLNPTEGCVVTPEIRQTGFSRSKMMEVKLPVPPLDLQWGKITDSIKWLVVYAPSNLMRCLVTF